MTKLNQRVQEITDNNDEIPNLTIYVNNSEEAKFKEIKVFVAEKLCYSFGIKNRIRLFSTKHHPKNDVLVKRVRKAFYFLLKSNTLFSFRRIAILLKTPGNYPRIQQDFKYIRSIRKSSKTVLSEEDRQLVSSIDEVQKLLDKHMKEWQQK